MLDTTRNFVFLSYSHEDKESVEDIVAWFHEKGYNIAYDQDFGSGDNWQDKAESYIQNANCKGCIFLLSKNSMISNPVKLELIFANEYSKPKFCISIDNCSPCEIYSSIQLGISEESKKIAEKFTKTFPKEIIFTSKDQIINKQTVQLENKLHEWGVVGSIDNLSLSQYTSALPGETKRLDMQQEGYKSFDMEALDKVISQSEKQYGLTVLDLGCSSGSITKSRFSSDRFKTIIGVDYNDNDIQRAKENIADPRFNFFCMDLESENFISDIQAQMNALGVEKVDIIFIALTLHHLKNPQNLLQKVFDLLEDGGRIIIRGSDDGGKLCYPESEVLSDILTKYDEIVKGVTDRHNGRKLYSQLTEAGYENVTLTYQVADTCNKTRQEREYFYKVGFGFRVARLQELAENNKGNRKVQQEVKELLEKIERMKTLFASPNFWYCNVSYIATAKK